MHKIRTKILKKTLAVTIIALLVCIILSLFAMNRIKGVSEKSSSYTADVSAQSSSDSLINQAIIHTVEYTDFCSQAISLKINSIIYSLDLISKGVCDIYEAPSEYDERPYNHVSLCPTDYCMQWILPEDIEMSGEIEKEAFLLGNTENNFKNMKAVYKNILSIYLTTESGINIGYDNTADKKPQNFEGRTTDWYKNVKETKKPYISKVYLDSFGRGLMVTLAVPCIGEDGELYGVLGVDFLIEELNDFVNEIKVGQNGYAMVVSHDMVICANGLTDENGKDFDKFLGNDGENILKEMIKNKSGVIKTVIDNKEMYAVYSEIGISDWITVFVMPKSNIVEPSMKLSDEIKSISDQAELTLKRQFLLVFILWGIILSILIFAVVYVMGKVADDISNPISKLCSNVEKIGNGNLDYKSDINTGDEIQELSISFERMTKSLGDYIDNLAKVTADKQRISTELAVATQIQASVLPCIFPAYPLRSEFDIYATMTPAKEVGGDFYDFYLIGEDKLGIVMADVSGKGVPAALFMMISKALIKNLAFEGFEVNEIFEKANSQLNENNDAFMFVTAFMAIIDLNTGVMNYVNAGHNPPLIKKKNNSFKWLDVKKNCILAVMPGMKFEKQSICLNDGDIIFTYTDGVTEAVNKELGFYGDKKLIEELNNMKEIEDIDMENIVSYIRRTIDDFANGAEQADDITMLVFKYLEKR